MSVPVNHCCVTNQPNANNDALFPMIPWIEWDQLSDSPAFFGSAEIIHSAELGWKVQGFTHIPRVLLSLHLASPHGELRSLHSVVVSGCRRFQDFFYESWLQEKSRNHQNSRPRTGTASLLSHFIGQNKSKANTYSRIVAKRSHVVMVASWAEQCAYTQRQEIGGGHLWRLSERARNTDFPPTDPRNSWGPLLSFGPLCVHAIDKLDWWTMINFMFWNQEIP